MFKNGFFKIELKLLLTDMINIVSIYNLKWESINDLWASQTSVLKSHFYDFFLRDNIIFTFWFLVRSWAKNARSWS